MSIKSDIDDTIKLWASASLPTKGLLLLSVFLATSSITSLADVVFKWKGFILQGIEIYREWLRAPIAYMLAWVKLPEFVADIAISFGLVHFVYKRSLISKDGGLGLSSKRIFLLKMAAVCIGGMLFGIAITVFPGVLRHSLLPSHF